MQAITQNPTELLRFVNMGVGGAAVAGGIIDIIHLGFSSIIIGVYEILIGALVIFLEIRTPSEEHKALVQKYASFMHSFLGRGVFYVLLGVLMLNYHVVVYILGSIVGLIGLIYIGLEFANVVEPPSTMQPPAKDVESQPVWQGPTE